MEELRDFRNESQSMHDKKMREKEMERERGGKRERYFIRIIVISLYQCWILSDKQCSVIKFLENVILTKGFSSDWT